MSGEEHPCIVALCNCGCGRVVYANAGEKLSAKEERELGGMVSRGYEVRRTTVGWARQADWFCETKRKARDEAEANTPEAVQRRKYEAALAETRAASGIEAATADETRSGSAVGESPVGEAETPESPRQ